MNSSSQKRKQSNFRMLDEPMNTPISTTIRSQVSKRVSGGSQQNRQNPVHVLPNQNTQVQADLELEDEIGWEDNHFVGCHTVSSQVEQLIQQNRSALIRGTTEVQNRSELIRGTTEEQNRSELIRGTTEEQNRSELLRGTTEVQNRLNNNKDTGKRKRGPTHMLEIWGRPSTLSLIQLGFDPFGRPTRPNQSKFSEFLGTIARKGMYCPLDAEDWHKIPIECKTKMLRFIKSRYDISLGDEGWILTSINKKWRNWKSILKKKYFKPDTDVPCPVDEEGGRVLQDQWTNLLAYWNKDEVQARSDKNKDARSKRLMEHLTGKKPFAAVYDKLEKEKGHPPSRAEMLESCYTNNENNQAIVSKYLEEIEKLRSQLPEGSEDPVGPNDLFAQVTGPDKPGRVRMFGEGVSPSDVWGQVPNRYTCKRIMLEHQSEIKYLKNTIEELRSEIMTLQSSGSSGRMTSVSHNLLNVTPPNQQFLVGSRVALRSITNQETVVAEGYLQRIDPNREVGMQILGENWDQVHVKVVLQDEELLVRPYGYCQTLGDSFGEVIAWPCNYVTPIG